MAKKRYEEVEHTADIRLKVYGADEKELFSNGAFALFDRMVDLDGVHDVFTDEIEAEGGDLEETLINFLSELLWRFDARRRVYRECRIAELSPGRVRSLCIGEEFDPARHHARQGIKAVTFHDVKITRTGKRLSVVITFDV